MANQTWNVDDFKKEQRKLKMKAKVDPALDGYDENGVLMYYGKISIFHNTPMETRQREYLKNVETDSSSEEEDDDYFSDEEVESCNEIESDDTDGDSGFETPLNMSGEDRPPISLAKASEAENCQEVINETQTERVSFAVQLQQPVKGEEMDESLENGATVERMDDIEAIPSPAPSVASFMSEQYEHQRSSPLLSSYSTPTYKLNISQSSPLSIVFQRPDCLGNMPDSETSSRSSIDGLSLRDGDRAREYRSRSEKLSPSSGSEEDSMDNTDIVRKISKSITEDKFVGRGIDAPRGRIANIRRESNCSADSEAAQERLVKATQLVSTGFDEIAIENERSPGGSDYRRRTPSFSTVGDPISVVTNAFIPHSCSPSPTRLPDALKQCYSPSTHQMVRPNISYSPSPKHSPSQSPTRHGKTNKFVRSVSPILLSNRQTLKRKLTAKDLDFEAKRAFIQRNNTSPLVNEKHFPYPSSQQGDSSNGFASPSMPQSPAQGADTSRPPSMANWSQNMADDQVMDVAKEDACEEEMGDAEKRADSTMTDYDVNAALAAPLPDPNNDNF